MRDIEKQNLEEEKKNNKKTPQTNKQPPNLGILAIAAGETDVIWGRVLPSTLEIQWFLNW